jgi:3'-5' exoribonuclease
MLVAEAVKVTGRVNPPGRYAGELTVEHIEEVEVTTEILDALLPPFPESHDSDVDKLDALIASVSNPLCKKLLQTLLHGSKRSVFLNAVAARDVHHAYRGGLLQHTLEVTDICDACCKRFPRLNRDILITGALLHDFAKLDEMTHGLRAGEYTDNGMLIGHVAYGAARIIHLTLDWPEAMRNHLAHLILSHHERPEHGAAKVPATPEAVVLAHADAISAHIAIGFRAVDSAPPGSSSYPLIGRFWSTTRPE